MSNENSPREYYMKPEGQDKEDGSDFYIEPYKANKMISENNNRIPDKNSFAGPSSNNVESATINLDDSESQNEMAQRIREMKEKLRRQMDGMEKG